MATFICRSEGCESILPHDTGEDDVDFYGEIAALGLYNDQPFVSAATQRNSSFLDQTTTFFGKRVKLFLPPYSEGSDGDPEAGDADSSTVRRKKSG